MCKCVLKTVPLLSGMLFAAHSYTEASSPRWAQCLTHLLSALKTRQSTFWCINLFLISAQPRVHFLFLMLLLFVFQEQIRPGCGARLDKAGARAERTCLAAGSSLLGSF